MRGCEKTDLKLASKSVDEHTHMRACGTEMKRSGIEAAQERARGTLSLRFSGGDALRGNTRSHPEHDG